LYGVCFSDTPGIPRAVFVENTFNLGKVKQGEQITHKFQVKNEGTAPLLLDRVDFNLPGLTAKFKPEIPPGGEGFIQVDWNTTYFTASLKEVQSGNSYDLTITVPAGTPPGRYEEGLLLHTNHPKFSKVPVGVNVLVMRDVHAFPESVDFTGIDLSILKQNPKLIDNLYENVIVENRRGD